MGKIVKTWKRHSIPWEWAKLNGVLLVFLLLINVVIDDVYSDVGLVLLMTTNLIAFIIDLILSEHYITI